MADDRPPLEMPSFSLRRRRKVADDEDTATSADRATATPDTAVVQPRRSRTEPGPRSLPTVQVRSLPAASLTGVVVGGLAVLLAWLAGVGCEAVRGTSACGGGPGLLILLLVLVVLTWAGEPAAPRARRAARRVDQPPRRRHPGGAGAGVPARVARRVVGDGRRPGASAISYAASWWVTGAVGDDDPAAGASARASSYDVR